MNPTEEKCSLCSQPGCAGHCVRCLIPKPLPHLPDLCAACDREIDRQLDLTKSERAIEGRLRRAEELLNQSNRSPDLIAGCFGKHDPCTCPDRFPDRDPECPEHKSEP